MKEKGVLSKLAWVALFSSCTCLNIAAESVDPTIAMTKRLVPVNALGISTVGVNINPSSQEERLTLLAFVLRNSHKPCVSSEAKAD